jgi:hypothetical protein
MGDGADARGVVVALVGGQPVVAPPAGVGWGGDERLVPQVVERDLGVVGEAVGGRKGDPARLGEQGLDVEGVLSGERQAQQRGVDVAVGQPCGGVRPLGLAHVDAPAGAATGKVAMISWVCSLAALATKPTRRTRTARVRLPSSATAAK